MNLKEINEPQRRKGNAKKPLNLFRAGDLGDALSNFFAPLRLCGSLVFCWRFEVRFLR